MFLNDSLRVKQNSDWCLLNTSDLSHGSFSQVSVFSCRFRVFKVWEVNIWSVGF